MADTDKPMITNGERVSVLDAMAKIEADIKMLKEEVDADTRVQVIPVVERIRMRVKNALARH